MRLVSEKRKPEQQIERREVQCPLCGNRFEVAEGEACRYCPKLFRSCGMVACPRCSHEFPR